MQLNIDELYGVSDFCVYRKFWCIYTSIENVQRVRVYKMYLARQRVQLLVVTVYHPYKELL
jgi:succinate-acetate transporter protein